MLADGHRRELLSAMGVDVYVLRGAAGAVPAHADACPDWLVVAATAQTQKSTQCAQFRKNLPAMLGIPADRIRWIAEAADVPPAPAYLVLGAALAREFGAHMPAAQQQAAVIAVADEPAASFVGGVAKRALWQSLKPIARRAREVRAW